MADGIRIAHVTDEEKTTGLTVFVPPPGSTVAAEVRGQNAGTMNLPVLGPRGSAKAAAAIVLTGGSVFGLEAVAHLAVTLGERNPDAGVPFVAGAVVYDIMLGERAWPDREAAVRAYDGAAPAGQIASGAVGVGTGVVVGGALEGTEHGVKGGFGSSSVDLGRGVSVSAWAVVNSVGDVIGEDGAVLAGIHRDGRFPGALTVLAERAAAGPEAEGAGDVDWGRATTLVVVGTTARLEKIEAWQLAQAGHAGIAHAVVPSSSGGDGDTAFAIATGAAASPGMLALEAAATRATAAAVRDAVRSAATTAGVLSRADLPIR